MYDADHRLTSRSYQDAHSQLRIDLAYNSDGELSAEARYADLAGTELSGTSALSYDPAERTAAIVHSNASGQVLASFGYQYDSAGRLASETAWENQRDQRRFRAQLFAPATPLRQQ